MILKKVLAAALSCVLTLTALAACSSGGGHTHAPAAQWDRDSKEHWHLCECGEKLELAAHTLNTDFLCTVCGSEVWDYGDGIDVYNYGESGDLARYSSYDGQGALLNDTRWETQYDADGSMLRQLCYENGVLSVDDEYTVTADGENYLTKSTSYQADGAYDVMEYDADGNITSAIGYDAGGAVTMEVHSEYAYTADGESYESKATTIFDGETYISEYNEYNDIVTRTKYVGDVLEYAERYEREYNADGDPLWEKVYQNDRLVYEIIGYATFSNEYEYMRFPQQTIDYYEDGGKLVTDYDERGELAKETLYNADGSVFTVTSYTYEYDENGNRTYAKVYENDRLISDTEYALDSDGWSYKAKVTEFLEDGSKTVYEYDQNEELLRETRYDSHGNQIQG